MQRLRCITRRLPLSRPLAAGILLALAPGCGGGAPLLHPAHVLPPGSVTVGAGLSGQLALKPLPPETTAASKNDGSLQELGVAPGVAPWIAGRVGITGDNEVGLTYSGRAIRIDARHAFSLGKPTLTLSVGLGASAVMARRPLGEDVSGVYGGGGDVPILFGVRSASDIYAFWIGPRAGFEILAGRLQDGTDAASASIYDVQARHFYGMFVAGLRVGFRHVHVAIELDAGYHRVDGTYQLDGKTQKTSTTVQQLTLTPAGALEVTF